MAKKYNDILEMIKDVAPNKKVNALAAKEISKKRITKLLFLLRCKHNLTQKQVAEKIGCKQGRISKIENSYDENLSIKDLLDYAKALNLQLEVGYRYPLIKITDLIKYHAFKTKYYFSQLTSLAKNDEQIKKGIAKFHLEAIVNIGKIISDSLASLKPLPKQEIKDKERIHISPPHESIKDFVDEGKLLKK